MESPAINYKVIIFTSVSLLTYFILFILLKYNQSSIALSSLRAMETAPSSSIQVPKDHHEEGKLSVVKISREEGQEKGKNTTQGGCNIFDGRWVYDPEAHPLYHRPQCPFLSQQVSCQKNGRPDSDYERWRWQPSECQIPRFNGTDLLERWRGKRVILVGDSLNRNQWESLSCLLYSAVPSSQTYIQDESMYYKLFQAKDYNCTVEFFWSPYLAQIDEEQGKKRKNKILKLDTISSWAPQWRDANVIIFNTGHWWVHAGNLRRYDFLKYNGKIAKELEVATAFERAMKTWARWVDQNIDPNNTRVFFRSFSPVHEMCSNHTQPADPDDDNAFYMPQSFKQITEIGERVVAEMRVPVTYLNITRLSQFRREAHPIVYTSRRGKLLDKAQRSQASIWGDCSHWCLPGVPDTWNELLYASTIDSSRV